MALVLPVLHELSCSNETVRNAQNMSFGSNGVDQVRSLHKMPTQFRLANLGFNGPSSASFASTFVQQLNSPERHKTCVLGTIEWIRCISCEKF
jgi:hypothetical protein